MKNFSQRCLNVGRQRCSIDRSARAVIVSPTIFTTLVQRCPATTLQRCVATLVQRWNKHPLQHCFNVGSQRCCIDRSARAYIVSPTMFTTLVQRCPATMLQRCLPLLVQCWMKHPLQHCFNVGWQRCSIDRSARAYIVSPTMFTMLIQRCQAPMLQRCLPTLVPSWKKRP